jgi:DNA-binding transcriptional MerR regulator
MVADAKKVINLAQAARLLERSMATLRRWDSLGVYPTRRGPDGSRVYTESDLAELHELKETLRPGRPRKAPE